MTTTISRPTAMSMSRDALRDTAIDFGHTTSARSLASLRQVKRRFRNRSAELSSVGEAVHVPTKFGHIPDRSSAHSRLSTADNIAVIDVAVTRC